jgi:hypothetical protein
MKTERSAEGGGYLLSPDITDPDAAVSIIDPADGHVLETRAGGLEFASVETADGVQRLVTRDGKQIEQYPGIHAGFSCVDGHGVYGRCNVEGVLVAFKPRPQDQAFVYTIKRLP